MEFQQRTDAVKERLASHEADALVAAGAAPARYLSGVEVYSAAEIQAWYPLVVVPEEGEPRLFVSGLDAGTADDTAAIPFTVPDGSFSDAVGDIVGEDATVVINENVSAGLYSRLAEHLTVTFDSILSDLRAVKSGDEVEAIRTAIQVSETAFADTLQQMDSTATEAGTAGVVEHEMRDRGGAAAFPSIVASGSQAAHPHHAPRDTRLGEDVVLFDVGARRSGYAADIARTVHIGGPPAAFRDAYEAVQDALEAAEEELAAGVPVGEVDAAARDALAAAGYEDGFPHAVGHGLGLSVHEAPKISTSTDETLAAGNVVTLEPAVYRDGEFGVRIEDVYLVQDSGAERLTTRSRALDDHIIRV